MHDPMTVAFDIPRPWPQRERTPANPRWRFRGSFWHIAGRRYYWPALITVWHVEPRGQDSGQVCKHYRRTQGADGKWTTTYLRGWRWHVHHWRIQVRPLQNLRRWALTRCAWCGDRSIKGDRVNMSHQWDGPRARWWQGEPGLFHHDCSMVDRAHSMCLCDEPQVGRMGYGRCGRCSRFSVYAVDPRRQRQAAMLAAVPRGRRATAALLAEHAAMGDAIRADEEAHA